MIFNIENKIITWQEVSMSMTPPNFTAKDIFVIKESRSVQNAPKKVNKILDVE